MTTRAAHTFLTVVLFLASAASSVRGADYPVEWSTSLSVTSLDVKCGDTITLTWGGRHDVVKTAMSGCPTAASALTSLAPLSTGGSYTYTVKSTDTDFYLICTVTGHCESGQNLKVTTSCPSSPPTSATNATLDYSEPKSGGGTRYFTSWRIRELPNLSLKCGDDINFFWNTTFPHGILMKPYNASANANESCADLVADNKTKISLVESTKTGNYTWAPTENGDYFFICPVGQHCLNGQRFRASVTGCKTTSNVFKAAGTKSYASPQHKMPHAAMALVVLIAALGLLV